MHLHIKCGVSIAPLQTCWNYVKTNDLIVPINVLLGTKKTKMWILALCFRNEDEYHFSKNRDLNRKLCSVEVISIYLFSYLFSIYNLVIKATEIYKYFHFNMVFNLNAFRKYILENWSMTIVSLILLLTDESWNRSLRNPWSKY